MSANSHTFKLGALECWVFLDGRSALSNERFLDRFPDATEAAYRDVFSGMGLSLDDASSSMNILLVKMGDEMILFDSGEGVESEGGYLLQSMKLAEIAPDTITKVVITHAHGDHILGLLNNGEPVFPHATYIISKEEMAFWQKRIEERFANQVPIMRMIQEKGLRLIEMDEVIMPGLTAIPIPGHTPGQIALRIQSEGETLIHMADLLHSPMQFAHPEWSAKFDADTSVSVPTRRQALQLAAENDALTLFYHLDFPGLGYVEQTNSGFRWMNR